MKNTNNISAQCIFFLLEIHYLIFTASSSQSIVVTGDLQFSSLQDLDSHLGERSYIIGFSPSQADLEVIKFITEKPKADTPNVLRWYNHIQSFGSASTNFPKSAGKVNVNINMSAEKKEDVVVMNKV